MKHAVSIASVIMLALATFPASAVAQDKAWYGGISLGYSSPDDPSYRFDNGTETISLDDGLTARLTLGHDFGAVRADVRVSHYDIDGPSQIGSSTVKEVELIYLSATVNGSYDFQVHDKLTPFISIGAGLSGGRGQGTTSRSTEVGNRVIVAPAARAGVGFSYTINDTVSIVVDYDYLYTFASTAQAKVDDFDMHSGNLGLQFNF
jgi:opacity protein-like surface antigen